MTTAIVKGGVLLLHRTLEMSVMSEANAVLRVTIAWMQRRRCRRRWLSARWLAKRCGCMISELKTVDLGEGSSAWEVAQAVSVAAAYFEDTLGGFA